MNARIIACLPATAELHRHGRVLCTISDGTENDALAGCHLGAMFNVELTERTTAYVGVQYQNIGEFDHTENGRKAVLDLSKSIFFSIGFGYAF